MSRKVERDSRVRTARELARWGSATRMGWPMRRKTVLSRAGIVVLALYVLQTVCPVTFEVTTAEARGAFDGAGVADPGVPPGGGSSAATDAPTASGLAVRVQPTGV